MRRSAGTDKVQDFARDILRVLEAAIELGNDAKTAAFHLKDHSIRAFDGNTALEMIAEGRTDASSTICSRWRQATSGEPLQLCVIARVATDDHLLTYQQSTRLAPAPRSSGIRALLLSGHIVVYGQFCPTEETHRVHARTHIGHLPGGPKIRPCRL